MGFLDKLKKRAPENSSCTGGPPEIRDAAGKSGNEQISVSPAVKPRPVDNLPWENVYIFISSTFNDMHAERDYLVKRVFPELSEPIRCWRC